jgi:hypothetical protein
LKQFAKFTRAQGAKSYDDLPEQVEPFVCHWMAERDSKRCPERSRAFRNEIRGPVEQLLSLILPEFIGRGRPPRAIEEPFVTQAPGFFLYLREERGLRKTSIAQYRHWLSGLEAYLTRIEMESLSELSPAVLSAFVTDSTRALSKNTITGLCCSLRVFLRYLHREGLMSRDLAPTIEVPQKHRLSKVTRSITWEEVRRMLEAVDQRTAVGKRDYAILL